MTDQHHSNDPLEDELRSLQPRELTDGFMESLGQRLELSPANKRKVRQLIMTRILLSLVAIAALILVALWVVRDLPTDDSLTPSMPEIASPAGAPQEDKAYGPPEPTLIAYSRAMGNPRGNLEELLDYHARTLLPAVVDPDLAEQPKP